MTRAEAAPRCLEGTRSRAEGGRPGAAAGGGTGRGLGCPHAPWGRGRLRSISLGHGQASSGLVFRCCASSPWQVQHLPSLRAMFGPRSPPCWADGAERTEGCHAERPPRFRVVTFSPRQRSWGGA